MKNFSGTSVKVWLAAGCFFAGAVASADQAVQLPGITVEGSATPPGDIVNRDRDQRSPDVHWPTALSLKYSENYLVQAEQWPEWCPFSGKVRIKGNSPVLQMNTRFSWYGLDLPQDGVAALDQVPDSLAGKVVEYVPESRIGWYSSGTPTIHGPLCSTYHTWLITPMGSRKCRVIFEEVATGMAARYARGAYPEIVHVSHDRWLQRLKKVSEGRL